MLPSPIRFPWEKLSVAACRSATENGVNDMLLRFTLLLELLVAAPAYPTLTFLKEGGAFSVFTCEDATFTVSSGTSIIPFSGTAAILTQSLKLINQT